MSLVDSWRADSQSRSMARSRNYPMCENFSGRATHRNYPRAIASLGVKSYCTRWRIVFSTFRGCMSFYTWGNTGIEPYSGSASCRRDVMERGAETAGSICLDACELHHLGPLLGFLGDEL